MREFFTRLFTRVREFFGKMERGRLIRLVVLFVLIVAIIITAVSLLGRTRYATLFHGMSPEDAGEVYALLREQGVDARAQGTTAIEVPAELVDSLIIELAAQGYPKSGLSYELYTNMQAFGTTEVEKEAYRVAQREENLRKTLMRLDKVVDAIVLLTPANQPAFVIDDTASPASASVTLTLASGVDRLTQQEALLVAQVVATAEANLEPENVVVLDTKANYYDLSGDSPAQAVSEHEALRADTQRRLERQVISLLSPVFGEDKVHASVNVELDFDRSVSESIVFSPPVEGSEAGLEVSIKELSETVNGTISEGGVVGQDPNGTAPSYQEVASGAGGDYAMVSREANMEINSVKTQLERAAGRIINLSVAILLDLADERIPEDYTQQVENLVTQALGISENNVTVERLPYLPIDEPEEPTRTFIDIITEPAMLSTIIIAVSAIVVALLLMMMLRTMFKKAAPVAALEGAGQYVDVSALDEGEFGDLEALEGEEIEQIGTGSKSLNREQIENFIDRDPESAAALLRNWLSDA